MKITRKILRQWCACYDDEQIAALVPEDGLTPLEVAELDIPAEDRMWVLLREEFIPSRDLRLLACDWAEGACQTAQWTDGRSINAIDVGRRYADGMATDEELSAAAAAAAAAWATDEELSALAALAALSARSAAAANVEAWAAARSAAAANADAWAAANAEQLADVVRVLKQIDEAGKAVEA